MAKDNSMPDISSMKLSDMKKELHLYAIDCSSFVEKDEFTKALDHSRKNLPRPTTTYKEVEKKEPKPDAKQKPHRSKSKSGSSGGRSERSKASSTPATSSSLPRRNHSATPASTPAAAAPLPAVNSTGKRAARSPVVALQQIIEHPSGKIVGERNHSFLAGAPFSFSLKGTVFESDAATLRIPDGMCLRISSASVCRNAMESFLLQKGSIGVSLRIASEDNPQLLPIWTFDRDRSKSFTVTDLGIEICGPRTVRLLAYMEMGYSSRASVDMNLFGGVKLDMDKM